MTSTNSESTSSAISKSTPFDALSSNAAPRHIAFLVYSGFQLQDLGGPLAVFDEASRLSNNESYRCHIVSIDGGPICSSSGLEVSTTKIQSCPYDTLLVIGSALSVNPANFPPRAVTDFIRGAALIGVRRIGSVCTGAFALAEAGILDGRHATTHWKYAAQLQRQFPKVKVTGDRIFTEDGEVWTSAGITAGIDMALAMVGADLGARMAQVTAQMLIVPHRRLGSQTQFSNAADVRSDSKRIQDVLTYMREHLDNTLSTDKLAAIAHLSSRHFGRAFRAETGDTPAKLVERLRVEEARRRVEHTAESIEAIAYTVGFSHAERMRRAFLRVVGLPPQRVRQMASDETLAAGRKT
ncbi:GlxA family transcriptional regulator [Paraburkholderia graminis]|uniref:GlxA family transcriptional regulator n=1 Tax=Paraburkholderia graminis TaxID=60548 RepID=UPI0038B7C714